MKTNISLRLACFLKCLGKWGKTRVIRRGSTVGFALMSLLGSLGVHAQEPPPKALLRTEFIYESAPFPSCHASTIEESSQGLVAAWFGGTHEKHPDVGIWVSRFHDNRWTEPVEVANGKGAGEKGEQLPTWNPVQIGRAHV